MASDNRAVLRQSNSRTGGADSGTGNKKHKIVAAYKGDTFLRVGTVEEVAEHLGVTVDTVKFYCSPIHHKRKGENGLKCYRIDIDD
ncbi:hypothetical protein IGK73_002413 [Enterococcus sp. AZ102]